MNESLFQGVKNLKFCFFPECLLVIIFYLPNPEAEQLFLALCKHHLWGRGVKGRWLFGQDRPLGSVPVVSRLVWSVSPAGQSRGWRRSWAVGAEPGWAQPGLLDTAPCQEQLPRIPAELMAGMERHLMIVHPHRDFLYIFK